MSPLNILQVATSNSGGAGIAARRLNEALNSEKGIQSSFISGSGTSARAQDNEIVLHSSYQRKISSSARTLFQQKVLQNSTRLVSPLTQDSFDYDNPAFKKADIVHFHAFYNFVNLRTLEKVTNSGKRVFVTLHDERFFTGGCHYSQDCNQFTSNCSNCPQVKNIFQGLISRSFDQQKSEISTMSGLQLVSPSYWLADRAASSSIAKGLDIHVIRNPIPPLFFNTPFQSSPKIESTGAKRRVLGFISSDILNPYKGFHVLEKAIASMSTVDKKRFSLVLIGNSDRVRESVIPIIRKEARGDQAVAEALKEIDLLVVPSEQDNLPNVIGEALASGIPVCGSNSGGVPELLTLLGLPTFNSGDHAQLADEILKYDYSRSGEEFRNYASVELSYESLRKKFENLYESK